jgi:hypothetical protein
MTDLAAWGGPGIAPSPEIHRRSREALLRAGFENYEVCSVVRAAPPCWPLCMGSPRCASQYMVKFLMTKLNGLFRVNGVSTGTQQRCCVR